MTEEEYKNQNQKFSDWIDKIKSSLNNVILDVIRRSNPYIIEIADINFRIFFNDINLKITFFVSEYPNYKEHEKIRKDIETMLNLMQLDELPHEVDDTKWRLKIDVDLVENIW